MKQRAILLICLIFVSAGPAWAIDPVAEQISELLDQQLHGNGAGAEPLTDPGFIAGFYARRTMQAVWQDPARAAALLDILARAGEDGLDPADYHLAALRALEAIEPTPRQQAQRDLLLTDGLIRYAYHLRFGKVDPASLDPHWNYPRALRTPDAAAALQALADAPSLADALRAVAPQPRAYGEYRALLARLRDLERAGGWPAVPPGPSLKPGMTDPRVLPLRESLRARGLGVAAASTADASAYDADLAGAVEGFQRSHGLTVDGIAGKATLAALNVPLQARIDQVRVNMERARWVARDLQDRFVAINVAAFEIYAVDDGRLVWRSRVQVGRPYRRTPVFQSALEYLVFNPTWTVPPTILRNDILPRLRTEPEYLARQRIRVLDRAGGEIDATAIDWAATAAAQFPYLLRQDAGPGNALGRIKFNFPNPYAVYLHDTPNQRLFEQSERTFSSGCIRVERARELAALLLGEGAPLPLAEIDALIDAGQTRTVPLPRPWPILLLYFTLSFGEDGQPRWFPDVYRRDPAVLAALDAPFRFVPPEGYLPNSL